MLKSEDIIKNPTITKAGAVANEGIAKKIGERNSATPNMIAVTKEVSPVLPPAAMPAAHSTTAVVAEVPVAAHAGNGLRHKSVLKARELAVIVKNTDLSG